MTSESEQAIITDEKLAELVRKPWRPIETAPRDGTQVLLFGNTCGRAIGYWGKFGYSERWRDSTGGVDVTHWMPLPAKPA